MSVGAARHVCNTYYTTTLNPIVQHHVDSYDDFVERRIPVFLKASNPINLVLGDDRAIRVYLGGKEGKVLGYRPPVDELGSALMPNTCRVENKTYYLDCIGDIEVEYQIGTEVQTEKFEKVLLARLPLMLRSKFCHLTSLTPPQAYEQGEDYNELGGYFVIDGGERVLLTQERLGNNIFYSSRRKVVSASVDEEQVGGKTFERGEDYEYIAGVRSVSEDGTRGPWSHFLVIPSEKRQMSLEEIDQRKGTSLEIKDYGTTRIRGMPILTLPGFTIPVPILSVFQLLGITTDKDLYDVILAGIPQEDRSVYDDLFLQFVMGHKPEKSDLETLKVATKSRSEEEVFFNLQAMLLPHVETEESDDTGTLFRRKAYGLGYLFRICMDVALGIKNPSDRDHFRFKRFDVSGDLCFQEFRRIYKDVSKEMKLKMDTRIHYEEKVYAGKGMTTLLQRENIGFYWRPYEFSNQFSKSFKSTWGGKDGISQILNRYSTLGTVSMLRRSNLQMDPSVKALGARRLHGSSFGLTCPSDVPDGRDVGMKKHLSLLAAVSTPSPSADLKKILVAHPGFKKVADVHPSTWNPSWTRVVINGDIYGIVADKTSVVYAKLIEHRRKSPGFVSVAWNRTDNELVLSCDSGRPTRPVYRPGVTSDEVLSKKTWTDMNTLFDFVDADEADTIRISMTPMSKTLPSEIHGVFMLSPLSAVIPFADHNPSPRVAFSCAQSRAGASWYHSNFNKRFDTMALILNSPKRPICETWLYPHILGRGGCLPYGDNVMVAISMYSGYNQEDSVILNKDAMRRGMFATTYFHSYNVVEEMINETEKTHTEIGNPVSKNLKLKADKDYSKLDENGIIRLNSDVDENTVLVGIISGTNDASALPHRGQRGRVDGIQFFDMLVGFGREKTALRGVKIRIAETRTPILGDKFSSRAGQKGTVGMILPESDMPFTAKGLRPDLILNPHAIPSRMTTGQMLESMSARIGVALGTMIDATPFSVQDQAVEYRELLRKIGLEPNGSEIMYNGMTGEQMEMEIFVGPTYYLRSKLMVEDKINYRDTGAKTLLTHQPLEGRSAGGGLRVGEMERDALIAHGVSEFIEESFMLRSDESEALFQPETGLLDTTGEGPVETLRMPYSMNLFIKELESMHIRTNIVGV
jgi:DNA-directed RNA polymerase II subunit RPB2